MLANLVFTDSFPQEASNLLWEFRNATKSAPNQMDCKDCLLILLVADLVPEPYAG